MARMKPQTQVSEENGVFTIFGIERKFRIVLGSGATLEEAKDRARTHVATHAAHLEVCKVREIEEGASKAEQKVTQEQIEYLSALILHIVKL